MAEQRKRYTNVNMILSWDIAALRERYLKDTGQSPDSEMEELSRQLFVPEETETSSNIGQLPAALVELLIEKQLFRGNLKSDLVERGIIQLQNESDCPDIVSLMEKLLLYGKKNISRNRITDIINSLDQSDELQYLINAVLQAKLLNLESEESRQQAELKKKESILAKEAEEKKRELEKALRNQMNYR